MSRKHALPTELTIYAAGPARALFMGWLAKLPAGRRAARHEGTPLAVDGAGVQEVDAAGVQLLLSLSRSLASRKRTLRLVNASGPLARACETLGATRLLESGAGEGACA